MISQLLYLDNKLTLILQNLFPHNRLFDFFFSFFSLAGVSVFIWIIILILAIIFEETKHPGISRRDKKFIIIFTLSFLITGFLVNIILKNLIARPRPFFQKKLISPNLNKSQLISTYCPTDFSFPSAHASASFAAATVLSAFDKKRKWFYYITAVLISYSRIYLGCHFFTDVLSGGLIGYFISKIIVQLQTSVK